MALSAIQGKALSSFKGKLHGLASLTPEEIRILKERFSRSKILYDGLEAWLKGAINLPVATGEYNRLLARPINGTYYRFFPHLDKIDRLWEIIPEKKPGE